MNWASERLSSSVSRRVAEISSGQMSVEAAVQLSGDLQNFSGEVKSHSWNGIVGDIRNYHSVDAQSMFNRMLKVAVEDVDRLLNHDPGTHSAGDRLW